MTDHMSLGFAAVAVDLTCQNIDQSHLMKEVQQSRMNDGDEKADGLIQVSLWARSF